MMQLLKHPEHGFMHVYNNLELEKCLENGWQKVEEACNKPKPHNRGRPKRK